MLVVGLGNPGTRYAQTRHNIGFLFLDHLAGRHGAGTWQKKYSGLLSRIRLAGRELVLLKPQTFMNQSGESVQAALAGLRMPPEEMLVAHDELDLPFGTLRLKVNGGPGGNNGIRSIIERIGKDRYRRLRFGIGHPGERDEVVRHVLGRMTAGQQQALPELLDRAEQALSRLLDEGLEAATNWLHALEPLAVPDED